MEQQDKPDLVNTETGEAQNFKTAAERGEGLTQVEQQQIGPNEHIEIPDPDALWRASLAAELRPIALRYGRELFTLAANVNNASVGLAGLAQLAGQTRNELDKMHARQAGQAVLQKARQVHQILDGAIATFIAGWATASGFTREQLVEVQTDMSRATQLAKAAPPVGIILPSGGH